MDIKSREGPCKMSTLLKKLGEGHIKTIDRIMENKAPVSIKSSAANIANGEIT